MRNKGSRSKSEFVGLLMFLAGATLVLTNGFSARIFADQEDRFEQISPIAEVLSLVLEDYVHEPDMDKAVEGALVGIMNTLDRNSAYIPPRGFQSMQEETEGAFDGIGVHIKQDDEGRIVVFQPIHGAPAAEAGIRSGDIVARIDDVTTEGMTVEEAARRIKGPRGREVHLSILRKSIDSEEFHMIEFDVERGKIPLESIMESRMLDNGIAYIRVSDFKKNTAADLRDRIEAFKEEDMRGLVLDLRWNPGGLLSSSRDVCELFLEKNTLVTTTKGRPNDNGESPEDMALYTERRPTVPENMPLIILTSDTTASSSEIVTGALQYHRRALIVGEKTYGKGSVQTIIPLNRPRGSALRLTTALYYTPGDVTIDKAGILPDVPVEMNQEIQAKLLEQMFKSYEEDASLKNKQNHGNVTGNTSTDETIQDLVLQRAVEILNEAPAWETLLAKYHKDVKETQVAAIEKALEEVQASPLDTASVSE